MITMIYYCCSIQDYSFILHILLTQVTHSFLPMIYQVAMVMAWRRRGSAEWSAGQRVGGVEDEVGGRDQQHRHRGHQGAGPGAAGRCRVPCRGALSVDGLDPGWLGWVMMLLNQLGRTVCWG